MEKHLYTALILLASVVALAGCKSRGHAGKPVVTVSIPPQSWMLQKIAGNDIEVNTLLPPGSDPETFEPSIKAMRKLETSAEYAMVGTLPFELVQKERLHSIYPSLTISESFGPIHNHSHDQEDDDHRHDHDHAHEHADHHSHHGTDPHVWTTPENLTTMADSLLLVALRINPVKADTYRRNHARLLEEIDRLHKQMLRDLTPLRGRDVVIWHPTLTYMARDFGFHQLSIQEGHKEPTPRRMADAIDEARRHNAVAFVVEEEHSPRMALALNESLKLPLIGTSLMQPDIINSLKKLSHDLASAAR